MASHNDLGKYGEKLGREYLAEKSYTILHMNWKHSYYEIDIIACRENVLHFVEVKTRRSRHFGLPEESVDRKKFSKLMRAAEEYVYRHPNWKRIQYDVLSVFITAGHEAEFFFIEDVYL